LYWTIISSASTTRLESDKELPMNAVNVIAPYKWNGMWVFDDPRVGLVQEPFVAGADTMIDRVVADIPEAEDGFNLIFSITPFPGYQHRLDWRREENGGNWYYAAQLGLEGWLCPALLRYFSEAPKQLYVQTKSRVPTEPREPGRV
jgi:hypothetical protein